MQEADRQRLDLLGLDQLGDRGARGREIERGEHAAVIAQALRHLAPIAARDEWRRKTQPQVEHVIAALEAHIERVAKACGHEQARACALALDQRVGHEGRAVRDALDRIEPDAGGLGQRRRTVDHRARGIVGRSQKLVDARRLAARAKQGKVGERAADIDADAIGHGCSPWRHPMTPASARATPLRDTLYAGSRP